MSQWEMIDYLRQRRIAAQYDLADFQRDVATVLGGSAAEDALQDR